MSNPLQPDHPLVTADWICPECHERFVAGDRIELRPIPGALPDDGNVESEPVHRSCA